MKNSVDDRPDPLTPEHQLIREAAVLPNLSGTLRARVLLECQGQVRAARWKRRLTVAGALVAVACLLVAVMSVPETVPGPETADQTPVPLPMPDTPSYLSPGVQTPVIPVPSGDRGVPGSVKRGAGNIAGGDGETQPLPEEKQKQLEPRSTDDINLLIDELHRRNRRLCGMFLW